MRESTLTEPQSLAIAREIFSTAQAAEFMGCAPQTIRALAVRGELRSYKFGRHLKFKRADLLRAMKPVKVYRAGGDDLD